MTTAARENIGRLLGFSAHPASAYQRGPWSEGEQPLDVCADCAALCCTTYLVPLSVIDAHLLGRDLNLPLASFATLAPYARDSPTWWVRIGEERQQLVLRRRARRCVFRLGLGGHTRCAVHALRPLACQLFPRIANATVQRRAPRGMLAQRPPGDCPRAWPASAAARAELDRLIVEDTRQREIDQAVLRTWSRQLNLAHTRVNFFSFLELEMDRRARGEDGPGPWRTALW